MLKSSAFKLLEASDRWDWWGIIRSASSALKNNMTCAHLVRNTANIKRFRKRVQTLRHGCGEVQFIMCWDAMQVASSNRNKNAHQTENPLLEIIMTVEDVRKD